MTQTFLWHPARADETLDPIIPLLLDGAVIIYPTETVYGLGGIVREDVVTKITRIKGRPTEFGLILLMPSIRHVLQWAEPYQHPRLLRLAQAFWPGPLTIVISASHSVPEFILREDHTLAVRISSHRFCLALIQKLQQPFISTSANLHGEPPARKASEALRALPGVNICVDGGTLSAGRPSTILSLASESPRILRSGPISRENIEKVLHIPVDVAE